MKAASNNFLKKDGNAAGLHIPGHNEPPGAGTAGGAAAAGHALLGAVLFPQSLSFGPQGLSSVKEAASHTAG